MKALEGCFAVLNMRLDLLKRAIAERKWESAEFQYDRVLGAVRKLESQIKELEQGGPRG